MDKTHSTAERLKRQIDKLSNKAGTESPLEDHLPGLNYNHLRELRASGLNDDTIRDAGLYSETNVHKIRSLISCSERTAKGFSAVLVFPFKNIDGHQDYARIKPDSPRKDRNKKPIKYESPAGVPNQVYLPAGVLDRLDDPKRELLITEGEKKALKAMQEGFGTIGLVGVHGWKEKSEAKLLPLLERIAWKDRTVYIVFDSDMSVNPAVQNAATWLAHYLANRGAIVKVVLLPDGPPDADGKPNKLGLDDYLIAHDPGELRKLLDNALDPVEVVGQTQKQHSKLADPATEATGFLNTCRIDGVLRLRFWAGSWWFYSQGKYHEINNSEVRANVVKYLNDDYFQVGSSVVGNLCEQIRAHTYVSSIIQPPAWIDKAAVPYATEWKPHDIVIAKNGIIHLPSLTTGIEPYLAPATPALFTTSALDYPFDPQAPACPRWLSFLAELWRDDLDSIATLQEWFGYLLTPDTRLQKMLLLIGPKRSGKGTIARVIRAVIGEGNVCGPTLASLATNFGLWPLLGKMAAIISDARLSGRSDQAVITERLLSISGEDAQTIDRKNLEPVTTKLLTRFTIISNELPRLNDASGALAGRFVVLRLNESFYGKEDTTLTDTLLTERPGILLWAIEGWRRLSERGRFNQPESAAGMREAMDDLSSPVLAFVHECCAVDVRLMIRVDEIYTAWREWCEASGMKPSAKHTFGRDLLAAVPTLKPFQPREGDIRYRAYQGIAIK